MSLPCLSLTYDEFVATYQPVTNHLDPNAGFDGYLYETFGPELDHIRQQPDQHVWTILDGDEGVWIGSGYSFVNRIGYIVTALPWPANKHISVEMEN